MNDKKVSSLTHLESFTHGANLITFTATTASQAYAWISEVLKRFGYHRLRKSDKRTVMAYLRKMTNYSRQQLTRLIAQHRKSGNIQIKPYVRNSFPSRYTKDEVTQWEIVCSVEKISEAYLVPVLATALAEFPFVIEGFHTDNGSEYVNKIVAKLLKKLFIRFTKSQPRHSNDNALAECKNGAVVRKILGYEYIPQHFAEKLNAFNLTYVTPYLNYHRPCFFAEIKIDPKGKICKTYPYEKVMTPYEKLKSLSNVEMYLKSGVTLTQLEAIALVMSDNESAQRLHIARRKLFSVIRK